MRRPIRHVTGAAAILAVAVAASLALPPAPAETELLPGGPLSPGGAVSPGAASPLPAGRASPGQSGATELPDALWPGPRGEGGGSARPVDLLPVSQADTAALQAAVDRARARFGLNALAVGVAADSHLGWSGASGLAPDGRTPLTGSSPFAIASVTKTFTAAIVLQLAEEGRVRLDAQVTDYLPTLLVADGVTVRQLLSHTSGIADLLEPMRDKLNADPSRIWTPDEVVAQVGPSRFAPGTDWGYSNTNYVIAGMLVEEVTGNPFAVELEQRITAPMALVRTRIPPGPDLGYMLGASWTSAFSTSAALASTATDLVRWGDALYGGAFLRPASLRQMLTFNADGYGLGAERYLVRGEVGYGHSGLLRGYTTLLIHLPDSQLTIAVLATGHLFGPTKLLLADAPGQPSILDVALGIDAD